MITTKCDAGGVVEITIMASVYGQAGAHWRKVLDGPNHNGFGKIYIQRHGANERRYWHTYGPGDWYRGEKGANQDECPGAMFIWNTQRYADVEAVCAVDNQKLGRELGQALSKYPQKTPQDLWEVMFKFL